MRRLLIWCVLFIPSLAAAQTPAPLTATVANGQLMLTGAGFGTHGDFGGPAPFLNAAWNDFATAINGGNLALDGTNNAAWSYQTSGGRTPAKRWARKDWNPNTPDSIRRLGALSLTMSGTTGQYFSSFYLRCGNHVEQAAKFWRIYGLLPNPNDGSTQQTIFLSITDGSNLMAASNGPGNPSPTTVWAVQNGPLQCASRWQRFDVYMRDTAGDDYIQVDIDGVQAFRRGSQLPSKHIDVEGSASNEREQWVPSPWGGNGHTLDYGHMVDGDFFGFSDVYADYTRARVELSDSPTWAAARVKEIQPPLTWADGQITVQVNPGAFQAGQTVYAYVVHANGNVNAVGIPVSLGGSTTPPPQPPPVLSLTCPPPITQTLTSGNSAPVTFSATTSGGVSPITVTAAPASGSVFVVGTTRVTMTAVDAAAQRQACSFSVTLIAAPTPPPSPSGCTVEGRTIPSGTTVILPRLPWTAGNAANETEIAKRLDAIHAAGATVEFERDGAWAYFPVTCPVK